MESAIFLVLANKKDLPQFVGATEVTEKLGLASLFNDRKRATYPTCAGSGEGLMEAFEWLSNELDHGKNSQRKTEGTSTSTSWWQSFFGTASSSSAALDASSSAKEVSVTPAKPSSGPVHL
jgi:hypothetical protein